jgi:hypothetical protein
MRPGIDIRRASHIKDGSMFSTRASVRYMREKGTNLFEGAPPVRDYCDSTEVSGRRHGVEKGTEVLRYAPY